MVVTRKKPSAPAPPTSRTNSTQALPRAVNAKPTHSNLSTSDTRSDLPQSSGKDAPNGTPKSKAKGKLKKPKPARTRGGKRSFLDRLFLLFLATFAAYALYKCPSDTTHDNPLCRSLATYRTHVLEPYVIPPIRAAISHPTVVEPYEKYAKPIYQNYVQPVTPYIAAAQRRASPYVNTAIRLSKRASLRVWNDVIRVYWTRAIVPRYALYVQPHVDKYVSPIIKRVKYYNHQAEPYVRALAHHTYVYAHRAQKHTRAAYDRLQPYAVNAYTVARPYVSRAIAQVKPYLSWAMNAAQSKGRYVASGAMVMSQSALGRVGDLRREFVDPHVLRIWEKAVEKSGPSSTKYASITTSVPSVTPAQPEVPVLPVDVLETGAVSESSSTHTASPSPTATIAATVETVPSPSAIPDIPVSEAPTSSDVPTEQVASPTVEDTLEKAASVAEASAAHASNVIGEMEREIRMAEAEAAQVPLTATPDLAEAPVTTPAEAPEAEQALPSETPVIQQVSAEQVPTSSTEGEDLEDFFKEIGLTEEEKAPEPEPEPVPVAIPEEDEETRKAATAAKRAEIVGRHTRWQSELDTLAKDLESRVSRDVKAIRDEAIAHIGRLPSNKDSSVADGKGKEVIDRVQNDGEKLLKGLEAYVKKLTTRVIKPEDQEKEKETWEKVVDKVENRFKDVVRNIQEEVHNWYMAVREKETGAVLIAANEVKALADRAQADLGLDYAWLDDVTYNDWQKYHDLMRTYERFDQVARSLQNGTHPEAPEDSLIPLLNDLDREVQDMIGGFAVRMNTLVRDGDRWLAGLDPIPEPELEDDEEECEEEEEPQVSILPISPAHPEKDIRPEQIIMEKSPEQIEKMAQQAYVDARTEL